jgi:hypothetical protein
MLVGMKANGDCFLGQERSADGGIHATRDHNNIKSVLQNTKKNCIGHSEKKAWNACTDAVLLHDNARPYTAAQTQAVLEHFNLELFDQPPCKIGRAHV